MYFLLTSCLGRLTLPALGRGLRLFLATLPSLLALSGREGMRADLHNRTRIHKHLGEVRNRMGKVIRADPVIRQLVAPLNWVGRYRLPMSLQGRARI
jgi:hypothetical protein